MVQRIESNGMQSSFASQNGEPRPLSWEQITPVPLSDTEQARFGSVDWARPTLPGEDAPENVHLGIKRIVIGSPDSITIYMSDRSGDLGKRIWPQADEVYGYLGGGASDEAHTVYQNDSRLRIGSADASGTSDIRVVYNRGVEVDPEKIAQTKEIVLELLKTIQQDRAARHVKQAQRDLQEILRGIIGQQIAEKIDVSMEAILKESAIDAGLTLEAGETLPARIRKLAGRMKDAGIKLIEDDHFDFRAAYWPSAILKSWDPKTDQDSWTEWRQSDQERATKEYFRKKRAGKTR